MYPETFGKENWREWYRISAPRNFRFQLSLSPEAVKRFDKINWPSTPIVRHYLNEFGFKSFAPGGVEAEFGFEGVAPCQTTQDGWREFLFNLSLIGQRPPESKWPTIDWKRANAISVSLSILFPFLNRLDEKANIPKGEPHQLLTINDCGVSTSSSGSPISAYVFPTMRHWLETKAPIERWEEVEQAIRESYDEMSRGLGFPSELSKYHCRVSIGEPARLTLDCPGQASGLYAEPGFSDELNEVLWLNCHNVDSPVQQLSLLMGLAKICDLYRAEHT